MLAKLKKKWLETFGILFLYCHHHQARGRHLGHIAVSAYIVGFAASTNIGPFCGVSNCRLIYQSVTAAQLFRSQMPINFVTSAKFCWVIMLRVLSFVGSATIDHFRYISKCWRVLRLTLSKIYNLKTYNSV